MVTSALRGHIYTFTRRNEEQPDRYVLVVSSDERRRDKVVSAIMLSDTGYGHDVADIEPIVIGDSIKYVHCGMVTYVAKTQLVEDIGELSSRDMSEVSERISQALGIESYKDKYETICRAYNALAHTDHFKE